jgi:hypothetical protein
MTGMDQVLSEFMDDWNAGRRPDVDDYLVRVPAAERDELAEQLMTWLTIAPTPDYDDATRAQIRADPAVQAAIAAAQESGAWPELLPRLRERAGLDVRGLAARVLSAVGLTAGGKDDEARAADYLGQMEAGELDAARVSRRLLDALGRVLGVDGGMLAGAGLVGRGLQEPSAALMFRTEGPADEDVAAELDALSRAAFAPAPEPLDEVDRLFLGGPEG